MSAHVLSPGSNSGSHAGVIRPSGYQRVDSAHRLPWHFLSLYVTGCMVALPVVLLLRVFQRPQAENATLRQKERLVESVFAETKRSVLTALEFAFTA